ncbi:MAG TPA: PDZ domain-containing protein, partial [Polyangiaceae bacterium]
MSAIWVLGACARQPAAQTAKPAPAVQLASHAPTAAAQGNPEHTDTAAELAAASPAGAEASDPAPAPRPRSARERGWLGVELGKRAVNEPGVLVRDVMHGSPAARAGLAAGDVISSVDGENVARPEDVSLRIATRGAGQRVRLGILRQSETRLVAVDLEAFPDQDEILRRE